MPRRNNTQRMSTGGKPNKQRHEPPSTPKTNDRHPHVCPGAPTKRPRSSGSEEVIFISGDEDYGRVGRVVIHHPSSSAASSSETTPPEPNVCLRCYLPCTFDPDERYCTCHEENPGFDHRGINNVTGTFFGPDGKSVHNDPFKVDPSNRAALLSTLCTTINDACDKTAGDPHIGHIQDLINVPNPDVNSLIEKIQKIVNLPKYANLAGYLKEALDILAIMKHRPICVAITKAQRCFLDVTGEVDNWIYTNICNAIAFLKQWTVDINNKHSDKAHLLELFQVILKECNADKYVPIIEHIKHAQGLALSLPAEE